MNLRQIQAFVAVAEEGSFSKAAIRERATQSGMSQHIQALESQLDCILLERSREGAALTGQWRIACRFDANFYARCVGTCIGAVCDALSTSQCAGHRSL